MKGYVLITGASSGIGRAIAVRLAGEWPLILCGRDMTRLQETREMCGGEAELFAADFVDIAKVAPSLVSFLQEKGLPVEGFVHSAGMAPLAPLRMTSLATMQEIMNVNFFAAAEILRVLTSKKLNHKNLKSVVLISSIFAQLGAKGQSLYCASKGALDAFCRAMAEELAPSVRVNVIRSGAIATPISSQVLAGGEDIQKKLAAGYMLGFGHPEDIANMAHYLLSEEAAWTTGQCINVDGGRTAH